VDYKLWVRHVGAAGLLGNTPYAKSQVDQWVHFARSRFEGIFMLYSFALGYRAYAADGFNEAKKKAVDGLNVMELHFKHHPGHKFLLGDRITLADIILICSLYNAIKHGLDEESVLNHVPHTKAYLRHVLDNEHVKSTLGEIHFLPKFTPPQ